MRLARQEVSPITLELSRYIATAIRKSPPRQVMERAKIHLVDTFAAMISGSRLLPGTVATGYEKASAATTKSCAAASSAGR